MRYVFCYGTLRAGEINDIGRAAATHGIAAPRLVGAVAVAVAGRLYDFGNYPGMVAGGGRDLVWGDVYAIDERLVPVLDEIEEVYPGVEGLFVRQRASVELGGRRYDCLYYPVGAHAIADKPRIESGDWVQYRRAHRVTRSRGDAATRRRARRMPSRTGAAARAGRQVFVARAVGDSRFDSCDDCGVRRCRRPWRRLRNRRAGAVPRS